MPRSVLSTFRSAQDPLGAATVVYDSIASVAAGSLLVIGWSFEGGFGDPMGSVADTINGTPSGKTWYVYSFGATRECGVAYCYDHPGGSNVVITGTIANSGMRVYREGYGAVLSGTVGEINPRTLAAVTSTHATSGATSFAFTMPGDGTLFASVTSVASLPGFAATSPATLVNTLSTPTNYGACMVQATTGAGSKTIASTGGQAALINGIALAFNDPTVGGPVITGPSGSAGAATSTKTVAENSTAVHTFTADVAVTWSLNGGADAAAFAINPSTGELTFASAPSYETPTDLGDTAGNNTYVVVVRATATSGGATADQTVTVTVTNVAEPPLEPTIGTATAGDQTVSIAFTAPVNTGKPSITGYTATLSPGGITKPGASSPIVFGAGDGIVNGTAYTGTVTATNSEGTGPASAASNSVTPSAGGGGVKVPAVLLSRLLTPRS